MKRNDAFVASRPRVRQPFAAHHFHIIAAIT